MRLPRLLVLAGIAANVAANSWHMKYIETLIGNNVNSPYSSYKGCNPIYEGRFPSTCRLFVSAAADLADIEAGNMPPSGYEEWKEHDYSFQAHSSILMNRPCLNPRMCDQGTIAFPNVDMDTTPNPTPPPPAG